VAAASGIGRVKKLKLDQLFSDNAGTATLRRAKPHFSAPVNPSDLNRANA
jgi:hypothetical protein